MMTYLHVKRRASLALVGLFLFSHSILQCILVLVTGNDSLLHPWHQAHEDFRLQYKPNDTLSGEWEVSGLTAPNFVTITDSMTIPITNGSQYWGSTFHVAKNESCIALFVQSLTPEADNKSISLVDKLQGDKSPEKEYPSVILTEITSG